MSAQQVPRFSTYVEVDVDIDPDELESAGWVYVGKQAEPTQPDSTVLDVVRDWHDDEHPGPWRFCDNALCDRLRGRWYPGADS